MINNNESLRPWISQAFAEAIGNDEIDSETSYTFLLYMQLGMIKAAYPVLKQACAKARDLADFPGFIQDAKPGKVVSGEDSNDFTEIFEQNGDILTEIIREVWSRNKDDQELLWLEKWVNNCEEHLQGSKFEQTFLAVSKLICEQTGLNDNNLPYLSTRLLFSTISRLPAGFLKNDQIIRIA